MKIRIHPVKLKIAVVVLSFVVSTLVTMLVPQKANADSYYPDSNGNGIPNHIESKLTSACAIQGHHTYHLTWFDPSEITPAYGQTSYSSRLKSVAYICPGTWYTYSSNITHSITWADWHLSFPSGRTFYMGTAYRGGFSSVASLPVNINLSGVVYDQWNNFQIQYWGWAYPGGQYSCFFDPTWPLTGPCSSVTTTVSILIRRPDRPTTGVFDSASCDSLKGWARDPDNLNATIRVRVYQDALPAFGGRYVGEFLANVPSGDVGPHRFNINISAWRDAYPHTYYVNGVDLSTGREFKLGGSPKSVGVCAPPTCNNNLTTTPSKPEPGETFSAQVGVSYNPGSRGLPLRYDIVINVLGASGSPKTSPDLIAPYIYGHKFTGFSYPTTGVRTTNWAIRWNNSYYPVSASILGGQRSITCSDTYQIATKPYLRVYGNDVAAGGAFKRECSINDVPNQKATILTRAKVINPWDQDSNGPENWAGGATQFAAFALGEIVEFSSAGMHSPRENTKGRSWTTPVTDLTFGNFNPNHVPSYSIKNYVNNPTALTYILNGDKVINYGGRGGVVNCMPDFFAQAAASGEPVTQGLFYASPAPPSSRTIGTGQHIAEYVNGPVVIRSNIAFSGASTNWASLNSIPSYFLIVRGNIYIQPNVTQLDGVYIAQPVAGVANSGRIITCANGQASFSATTLYSACNTKLTINGAFIAKQVKFRRTKGTLKNATPNEAASSTNIAEVFNFRPELYVAPLPPSLIRTEGYDKYDFITSLPPIL